MFDYATLLVSEKPHYSHCLSVTRVKDDITFSWLNILGIYLDWVEHYKPSVSNNCNLTKGYFVNCNWGVFQFTYRQVSYRAASLLKNTAIKF